MVGKGLMVFALMLVLAGIILNYAVFKDHEYKHDKFTGWCREAQVLLFISMGLSVLTPLAVSFMIK